MGYVNRFNSRQNLSKVFQIKRFFLRCGILDVNKLTTSTKFDILLTLSPTEFKKGLER